MARFFSVRIVSGVLGILAAVCVYAFGASFAIADIPSSGYATSTFAAPTSGLTDFTLLIDLSQMPASWWSAVDTTDPTKGRATKSDGTTELPADWLSFDKIAKTGWVRVKYSGFMTSTSSQSVRIYPPQSANASYATSATYGQYNAYASDWAAYYPLDESPSAAAGNYRDRTRNTLNLTASSTVPTSASSTVGNKAVFNGVSTELFKTGATADFTQGTILAWATNNGASGIRTYAEISPDSVSSNRILLYSIGTQLLGFMATSTAATKNGGVVASTTQNLGYTWNNSTAAYELYINGVAQNAGSGAQKTVSTVARKISLGTYVDSNNYFLNGDEDEVQIHTSALSSAWIAQEYAQSHSNSTFWGTWSWNSGVPPTVPGTPTGVSAAAAPNQATVSFSAPASDGGSAILYYVASSTPGNIIATSTGSPITVTGLANGTSYTFQVYAINSVGSSTASAASSAVTPVAVAPTVATPTVATTSTTATFSSNLTSTGGANATSVGFNYGTTASYGSATTSTGSFGTGAYSLTVSGLSCGVTYHYQAFATNSAGTGTSSDQTFILRPCTNTPVLDPPTVATTSTLVTFSGNMTATGDGVPTKLGFDFGTTTSYGQSTTTTGSFGTGTFTLTMNPNTTLDCNTTYHYRAFAVSSAGTTTTADQTFSSYPCGSFQVNYSGVDQNGVLLYNTVSSYNGGGSGTHLLKIYQPTNPAAGVAHTFLFALPVEPESTNNYGDPVDTIRLLDAANTYNATIISPYFELDPWYADSDTDTRYRYESFLTVDLEPWVTANLSTTNTEQRWLIGFSKSGYGGIDLLMRHPSTFTLGAFWDFPADMVSTSTFAPGTGNYGTEANFQNNYRLTTSFLTAHDAPFLNDNRIWINGYSAFRSAVQHFDATTTSLGIQHTTATEVSRTHSWTSGWVASALAGLSTLSTSTTTLSTISAGTPGSTSATITWASDAVASSRVNYGVSSGSYAASTAEADTSTRVTSHSVALSSLVPCTLYYYKAASKNTFLNDTQGSERTFLTSGCTGSASVTASTTASISSSGGSASLSTLTLTVPASFKAGVSSAAFQIKKLAAAAFSTAAGAPSGKTLVGTDVYNLESLSDTSTKVSTFDSAPSVSMTYTPSDISGLDESALAIYRYDGSAWSALSGCSVNTSTHTVTCSTSNFSDFALFGSAPVASNGTSSGTNSGEVGAGSYLVPPPPLTPPVVPPSSTSTTQQTEVSAPYRFITDLRYRIHKAEVLELQRYLNAHGFTLARSGAGAPGHETDYFGPATYRALITFQEVHSAEILVPAGLKKGTGFFGPSTRAYINAHP